MHKAQGLALLCSNVDTADVHYRSLCSQPVRGSVCVCEFGEAGCSKVIVDSALRFHREAHWNQTHAHVSDI